jgi:hypothetical protein
MNPCHLPLKVEASTLKPLTAKGAKDQQSSQYFLLRALQKIFAPFAVLLLP